MGKHGKAGSRAERHRTGGQLPAGPGQLLYCAYHRRKPVKAEDGSIAIKAEEKGFDGGILTVIMGYDTNGTVTGIWVDASTQTKGIGSNVANDTFLAQFNGMDGTQNIAIGQGGFDAYSGATISSKALFAAINDCVNCYNELA